MEMWNSRGLLGLLLLLSPVLHLTCASRLQTDVDYGDPRLQEMLNTCIDSKNHKSKPGPEDKLHQQCSPWKDRSCCTQDTARDLHYRKMYNFDWNHCSFVKPLSERCRSHFVQDLCLYECSPNVGPWMVPVNNTFRKQRFFKVPLCQSDCNAWFDDCADSSYTCTDNWAKNMKWVKGMGNRCPDNSTCQTFRSIYNTPKYFCETVWDNSWEVVPDDEHCFRLWFDPKGGNPNDEVARWKAIKIIRKLNNANGSNKVTSSSLMTSITLISVISMLVYTI